MFNENKARAAQDEYLRSNKIHIAVPTVCYRCGQHIYSEYGHPVEYRLKRGRVKLDLSKRVPGISVERAGSDSINGCPFCNASFDD